MTKEELRVTLRKELELLAKPLDLEALVRDGFLKPCGKGKTGLYEVLKPLSEHAQKLVRESSTVVGGPTKVRFISEAGRRRIQKLNRLANPNN
jgi:hypothetical protein